MRQINQIIIHCSATPSDMDIGVEEIRDWHMGRGWSDVGYHFVIRRSGEIEVGRPIERAGAHARGHNAHSIGICMVGGNNVTDFNIKQFNALYNFVIHLRGSYPDAQVLGHRDLEGVAKLCPCFDVGAFFDG